MNMKKLKRACTVAYGTGFAEALHKGGYSEIANDKDKLQKAASMAKKLDDAQKQAYEKVQPLKEAAVNRAFDAVLSDKNEK